MIVLGEKVKDKISGLTGIATARLEYLNGCVQYTVSPRLEKGKTELVAYNIDEENLEVVGKRVKIKKNTTGGPTHKAMGRY